MKKHIVFIFILALSLCNTMAALPTKSAIDSLKNQLENDISLSRKCEIYIQLAKKHFYLSIDSSLEYSAMALEIAEMIDSKKQQADALFNNAIARYITNDFSTALLTFNKALRFYTELSDTSGISMCNNNIGNIYINNGDFELAMNLYRESMILKAEINDSAGIANIYNNMAYILNIWGKRDSAIYYYEKAWEIWILYNNQGEIAQILNNIGIIYRSQGNYEKALDYYIESLKTRESMSDQMGVALACNSIGVLYLDWGNHVQALKYFQKSLDASRSENIKHKADVMNNIGLAYKYTGKLDTALSLFEKSLEIRKKIGDKHGIATSTNNLGIIYNAKGYFNQAIEYYKNALLIREELNDKQGVAISLFTIGEAYMNSGDNKQALSYLKKSLIAAKEINYNSRLVSIYHDLAILSAETGRYNEFRNYFNLYNSVKDSIFNSEKHFQITEMETKYKTEKKDREIQLKTLKIDNQNIKITSQNRLIFLISIGIITLLITVVIILVLYLQKRRAYISIVSKVSEVIAKEKQIELLLTSQQSKAKNNEKYAKSNLTENIKDKLIRELTLLMEEERFFMKEQVIIEEVAENLNTNRAYLSQVINEHFGLNFNNYINQHRIKEAIRMFLDKSYDHYSIMGIAESVGFRSKASFIDSFKKYTKVTPSFFRKFKPDS